VFLKKCNFNKVHELVFNMCDSNMHGERIKIPNVKICEDHVSIESEIITLQQHKMYI
jgi:hypothetical protein